MRKNSLFNILSFRHLLLALLLLFSVAGFAQTEIDVVGTCLPSNPPQGSSASTKFFARYAQTPDSVNWNFGAVNPNTGDSLTSRKLQPIVSFPEEGSYQVRLVTWNNSVPDTVAQSVQITMSDVQLQIIDQDTDEQIPGEVVICDTKTLVAKMPAQGGGEPQEVDVVWFKPQSADDPNPTDPTSTITLTSEKVPGLEKYKDVGTYYVIYTDPASGCEIFQTFQAVVYEEQDQNNSRWYFGNGAGIDFLDNNKPLVTDEMAGADQAPQGNALVGDLNEDVLFLTNGEKVWYGNDPLPAANGDNVGGSQEVAQNSLFVKFPADQTLFYLFTINESGSLFYNILDLKIVTPRPGVALSQAGANAGNPLNVIPLENQVAEKLTSADNDSSGVWVVTHDLGDTFISYPVSPDGIGLPVRTSIGSTHTNPTGYMRISAEGVLAATVNEGGSSHIELFRFHSDSGTVTDFVRLDNLPASGTLYGLEFAGDRLYATVNNGPGGSSYLYQYTVDSLLDKAYIESSRVALEPVNEELGALQRDPNGELKIAVNGSQQLFFIPNPTDSLNSSLDLTNNTFDLAAGTNSTLGLPNFGQPTGSSDRQASVFAENVCEGDTLYMSATPRYPSNDVTFFFTVFNAQKQEIYKTQEPVSDSAQAVVPPDVYASWGFGQFTVQLQILNECSPNPPTPDYPGPNDEPVEATFFIGPIPDAQIDDTNNLILCEEQSVTLDGFVLVNGNRSNDTIQYNFTWYDAVSRAPVQDNSHLSTPGNKLVTDTAGVWYVVVEDRLTGCTGESEAVTVIDNRPQAELGDDVSICVGETLGGTLDANFQNAGDFSFAWFLNGQDLNNGGTTQPLNIVDTQFPGSYQFVVEITPATAGTGECFKRDTVDVLVVAEPLVRIVASENNCDGTAVLTAQVEGGSGDYTYQWSGPGITSGQGTRQIQISGTGAQDYTVNISDAASGCSTTTAPYTIDLENPLADLRLEVDRECGAVAYTLKLVTSYSGDSTDLTIRWFSGANATQEIESFRNLRTINAEEGVYRAEVVLQSANCADTASQEVELTPIANENLSLQSTYVLCPSLEDMRTDTLVVEGFQLYRWTNLTTGQTVVNETGRYIIRTEGNYELQVNDCEPVPFRVIYDCTPTLWLPNAIRVGGKNNSFHILNQNILAGVSDFQILILNRWGQPIWQSHNPSFEWFGTTQNGQPVMVGTYVYVITYRNQFSEDQKLLRQRGGITVLK